jgi:hypothetical protein
VIGLLLALGAPFALAWLTPQTPQIIPSNVEAVIVGKAVVGGTLQPRLLGLGSGGVRTVAVPERGARDVSSGPLSRGEALTPGGVRIRAKRAGVKFEFPSGRELLVSPDGRVHLRSGEKTLPFLRGLRILLGDGTRVTVLRGANARLPLASVEVTVAGRVRRLWSGSRRVVNASHSGVFVGTTLLALGDGGTLFTANAAGPLIGLERVLCPSNLTRKSPRRRLIILGEILVESLGMLPAHAPRRSVQFPQVKAAARKFAALSYLFQGMTPRPPGAVGQLWFQLRDEYRLKIESTQAGVLIIGLHRTGTDIPGVEWTISGRTELHFVRPSGGTDGGPRYFLRGIDLRMQIEGLLPGRQTGGHRAQVNRIVRALGGRRPRTLEVKRR